MYKKGIYITLCLYVLTSTLNANSQVKEQDVLLAINKGVKATKVFLKTVPSYQVYEKNKTILHYAVELNNYDVVSFLAQYKGDLAKKGGSFSETPLQDAIYYNHFAIAKLLISRGSPLDTQNVNGETALHIAAKRGNTDMVKALLNAGASANIADEEGNLAYNLVPDLMFEDSKGLRTLLEPEDNSDEMEASFHNDGIVTIDIPTINKTRTITIDGKNKTIDDKTIDNKSKLQGSSVGISIN